MKRDPSDRRYHERLAGSSLASILLHAMLAALLFAVVLNSSEEGAKENASGGEVVTIERRTPVVAQAQQAVPQPAAPQPFAPKIAPPHHAMPVPPAHQRHPTGLHELAKFAPTAPPNPSPLPQASIAPAPQPTQAVVEPQPTIDVAAVPVAVPSANAVAVTIKMPPTAAPSPVPTSAPTARPVIKPPSPTAAPSPKPATPAPVASPTVAPTAAAVVAVVPSPVPHPSLPPAKIAGVPSPNPTRAPAVPIKTHGTAPTPGPKGLGSPGPRAGNAAKSKPAASKPIQVAPTAAPARVVASQPAIDINARLRAMLPHNAVNYQSKSYAPEISLTGHLEPTPPPDVVAETKFLLDETGTGGDLRVKMWVTRVERHGPLTTCVGWMLRYPEPVRNDSRLLGPSAGTRGTGALPTQVQVMGTSAGLSPLYGVPPPIVVENATTTCSPRHLQPFTPARSSP